MAKPKTTNGPARRKAREYTEKTLRAAVRAYCVAEWKKLTGADWSAAAEHSIRETLNVKRSIVGAVDALLSAFDAAQTLAATHDFQAEILRSFIASISPEMSQCLDAMRTARTSFGGRIRDENVRSRLALWQPILGFPAGPHALAVLSLLIGQWPAGMAKGATVATVVDKERKAMVQTMKRLPTMIPAGADDTPGVASWSEGDERRLRELRAARDSGVPRQTR